MSKTYTKSAVAHNETLTCDFCESKRFRLGRWCRRHSRRLQRNGHPEALRLKSPEYRGERETATRFVSQHVEHPAVKAAVKWATRWLEAAAAGEKVPAASELKRLRADGITGRQIVEEALAVWLVSRWRPSRLSDDVRLTFALGNAVLFLSPRRKRYSARGVAWYSDMGSKIRRETGEHVRRTLGIFFMNASASLDAEQEEARNEHKALREPFGPGAFELPPPSPPKATPKAPGNAEALPFPTPQTPPPTNTRDKK